MMIQFLASKQEHVKEGLGDVMGGKILDHEAKDILNQGKALGRSEGEENKFLALIEKKLAKGKSLE